MLSAEGLALRREASRSRLEKLRDAAIKALGGVCPKCLIERDPRDLRVEKVSGVTKCWTRAVLHRRVVMDPDRESLARLICVRCRRNQLILEAQAKVANLKLDKENKGTGELYWIGGQRVEQMKRRTGIATYEGIMVRVVCPRLEDLGLAFSEEA